MPPGTCLVKVVRYDGDIEWDGGLMTDGSHVTPIGLWGLVTPNAGGEATGAALCDRSA